MSHTWAFSLSANIFFGKGSVSQLAENIARRNPGRGLLVLDPALKQNGVGDVCLKALAEKGIECSVFAEIEPNPHLSTIQRALEQYQREHCSFVLGCGGGSSMDAAKAVAVLSTNPGPFTQYAGDEKFTIPPAPIFAIPTTAGTGSEVTGSSVVVDDLASHAKYSIRSPLQTPLAVAMDPSWLSTLPPRVIASGGLDALSHALESYVSTWSTPITRMFSLAALRLIIQNLYAFHADPHNEEAASNMLLGSHLAGYAFSRAKTGMAHTIANGLEPYIKIPHGAACGLATAAVIRFTCKGAPERYAEVTRCFLEAAGKSDVACRLDTNELATLAAYYVENFISGLDMPTNLHGFEITPEIAHIIAKDGTPSIHCKVSPVIPTEDDIVRIILQLAR